MSAACCPPHAKIRFGANNNPILTRARRRSAFIKQALGDEAYHDSCICALKALTTLGRLEEAASLISGASHSRRHRKYPLALRGRTCDTLCHSWGHAFPPFTAAHAIFLHPSRGRRSSARSLSCIFPRESAGAHVQETDTIHALPICSEAWRPKPAVTFATVLKRALLPWGEIP